MKLTKPYTNKQYADFIIANQGKKLCQNATEIWFEEYPVIEATYTEKRQEEYPAINEQLDMIYWDKVNNTNNWQTTIAEIKAKYPKD